MFSVTQPLISTYFAPAIAFLVSLLAVWSLCRTRSFALDYPNERSLHQAPIPRTGGLGLHAGILAAGVTTAFDLPGVLIAGYAILIGLSFVDDVRGIPVLWRLLVHLCAAAIVAATAVYAAHGMLSVLVCVLAIAWMTNLYNFMDGADGLAGGMAFFGFTFYGIAAWFAEGMPYALVNFSIAAASAAFLLFNFHPARIFMGDVGSVPLGFLAGSLGVAGALQGYWPWWFPVLIFSPFIVDATMTLLLRGLRGERIWQAHRDHYYQRLVRLGWGHRHTACGAYAAMTVCGVVALWAISSPPWLQGTLFLAVTAAYALLLVKIDQLWRSRSRSAP